MPSIAKKAISKQKKVVVTKQKPYMSEGSEHSAPEDTKLKGIQVAIDKLFDSPSKGESSVDKPLLLESKDFDYMNKKL